MTCARAPLSVVAAWMTGARSRKLAPRAEGRAGVALIERRSWPGGRRWPGVGFPRGAWGRIAFASSGPQAFATSTDHDRSREDIRAVETGTLGRLRRYPVPGDAIMIIAVEQREGEEPPVGAGPAEVGLDPTPARGAETGARRTAYGWTERAVDPAVEARTVAHTSNATHPKPGQTGHYV